MRLYLDVGGGGGCDGSLSSTLPLGGTEGDEEAAALEVLTTQGSPGCKSSSFTLIPPVHPAVISQIYDELTHGLVTCIGSPASCEFLK